MQYLPYFRLFQAYNLHMDSDEELRQMERQNHSRKKYNHIGRRQKKYHHPRFFENDSDFEYDDEEKSETIDIKRLQKAKTLPQGIFDKMPVKAIPPYTNPNRRHRNKSGLSVLVTSVSLPSGVGGGRRGNPRSAVNGKRDHMQRRNGPQPDNDVIEQSKYARYEPQGGAGPHGNRFQPFYLTVYFGEYLHSEDPIRVEITSPWTVSETIKRAIAQWNGERPMSKLKGKNAEDYLMRQMDDDDIEDDLPAFAAHQKIHAINETNVGLQFVRGFARSIDATSPMEETPEIQKARSVLEFSNMKNQILVRVSIPGPYNESHVLPIDRDSYTLTLLDMVALLNRKKVYC